MRHRQSANLATVALTALLAGSTQAYHPLVTDDTGTQGSAGNQLEFVLDGQKRHPDGITTTTSSGTLTFTRGVSDNLDLYLAAARQNQPASGLQNTAIGAKWRLWENTAKEQSLAVRPEIRLPVSRASEAAGLGNARTSWGIVGIFTSTTDFGELHFNLAIDRNRTALPTTDRSTLYRISLAPVWVIGNDWKAGFDIGVETNPDRAEKKHLTFGQLALIHSPNKNLDLSLGLRHNFRDGAVTTTAASIGVTGRF